MLKNKGQHEKIMDKNAVINHGDRSWDYQDSISVKYPPVSSNMACWKIRQK
jgi:predicted signal transduction protein with EAL and GGDEF domain